MNNLDDYIRMENAEEYRRHFKSKLKTQCDMTIEYLEKYGSITPLEALNAYGCLRLGARISDLRHDGYNIRTEIAKGEKNYAIYMLE